MKSLKEIQSLTEQRKQEIEYEEQLEKDRKILDYRDIFEKLIEREARNGRSSATKWICSICREEASILKEAVKALEEFRPELKVVNGRYRLNVRTSFSW